MFEEGRTSEAFVRRVWHRLSILVTRYPDRAVVSIFFFSLS